MIKYFNFKKEFDGSVKCGIETTLWIKLVINKNLKPHFLKGLNLSINKPALINKNDNKRY